MFLKPSQIKDKEGPNLNDQVKKSKSKKIISF